MTKIYLIRHAEAEGNLYRRSQGHYDSNVTELGKKQIAALAERFREIPVDALWSSDLHRTRSTASAILKYHPELTLNLTRQLREINVGIWEERPWGNLAEEYPEQMYFFSNDPDRWSVPGGEPYRDVAARVRAFVLKASEMYEGKTLACVTHGLAVRAFLCTVFGIPSNKIKSLPYGDNTSVTLLDVDHGEITVEYYNDASHLTQAGLSTFDRQGWRKSNENGDPVYGVLHPLDPKKDAELYIRCYSDTWLSVHGDLRGFSPAFYLNNAQKHAAYDESCLMRLDFAGRFAGIIELDPERGQEDGAGWISLIWVEPDMRSSRMGVQLIGHAVSCFRRRGRRALRLHVAETNAAAIGFYENLGFRRIGTAQGAVGKLYLMEWDISPRVITPDQLP